MLRNYHLFFSGKVQGVWFRATSKNLARQHQVTGWVRNLPDARVEIVSEAEKQNLDNFLEDLKEKYKYNITGIEKKENKYTGKYQDFRIGF